MGIFNDKTSFEKSYDVDDTQISGLGSFDTVVKKCKSKATNEEFAVKIIDKIKMEDDIERELEMLGMINHPNIIKVIEVFNEPKTMKIITEPATGGELIDKIIAMGQFTEEFAAMAMRTLCGALAHLHEKTLVHGCLTPACLLLASDDGEAPLKIVDLGFSRLITQDVVMKTTRPVYVAPEKLQNTGPDSGAVDLWSAGVILYVMLCGFPPFNEEELPALVEQILNGRYDFPSPWWDAVSDDAKDLVRKMLTVDPKSRVDATQALQHTWMKNSSAVNLMCVENLAKLQKAAKQKKVAEPASVISEDMLATGLTAEALKAIDGLPDAAKAELTAKLAALGVK